MEKSTYSGTVKPETAAVEREPLRRDFAGEAIELARQWRYLGWFATAVALLAAPIPFLWLWKHEDWELRFALVTTLVLVAAFRGLVDLVLRRIVPWPTLFGTDDARLRAEDIVSRRRTSFWGRIYKLAFVVGIVTTAVWLVRLFFAGGGVAWSDPLVSALHSIGDAIAHPSSAFQIALQFLFLALGGIALYIVPMLIAGVSQIRSFEPGDTDWGVSTRSAASPRRRTRCARS